MPLDATRNYGTKTDAFFTQSLVGFGMSNDGNGRIRYIKELKNKLEQDGEKQSLSIFQFADSEVPLFDYLGEANECDVLPSRSNHGRGIMSNTDETSSFEKTLRKPGRPEKYAYEDLREMVEAFRAGITWKKILENRGIPYSKNEVKLIKLAADRHGIDRKRPTVRNN